MHVGLNAEKTAAEPHGSEGNLSSWRTCFSRCRVRPLPTGQAPTGWNDQIAVVAHMRT
jgi:hypothetical protein